MDIKSIKTRSIGSGKYRLLIVDIAKDFGHSSLQPSHVCIRKSYRCYWHSSIKRDNAGENKYLEKKCLSNQAQANIKFEFTPRYSRQYNGKAEYNIAVLYSRIRTLLTATRITSKLRQRYWQRMANMWQMLKTLSPSDMVFLHTRPAIFLSQRQNIHQFGEVAIIQMELP